MNVPVRIEQQYPAPALVPANMSEAIELATLMASARLVPKDLQKSPADCLMVIQQAIRWQMDPFAVAQECSVIQGKLMHSGKLVAAVVNARGNLTHRLSFEYSGTGDGRTITVSGRMQGEGAARTVSVALRDARTNNVMWQKQPDQQLMYHGTRVWARRHTPELMLGVYSPEEFEEAGERPAPELIAPAPRPRRPATPAPNPMLPAPTPHDAETGEVIDADDGLDIPEHLRRARVPELAPIPETPPDHIPTDVIESIARFDKALEEAAAQGTEALKRAWAAIPAVHQKTLKGAKDRRHKPAAEAADAAANEAPF